MAPQARGQAASAFGDFRHRELATRTGRNYKLLPALATNSPPDCLLNASRSLQPRNCFANSSFNKVSHALIIST